MVADVSYCTTVLSVICCIVLTMRLWFSGADPCFRLLFLIEPSRVLKHV